MGGLMNETLTWIGYNQWAAFGLGIFILILAINFFSFFLSLARAFTGHYPPPRPVVQCDGNCKRNECCRCCEDGCEEDQCDCQTV